MHKPKTMREQIELYCYDDNPKNILFGDKYYYKNLCDRFGKSEVDSWVSHLTLLRKVKDTADESVANQP